jgi:hypothetical protein
MIEYPRNPGDYLQETSGILVDFCNHLDRPALTTIINLNYTVDLFLEAWQRATLTHQIDCLIALEPPHFPMNYTWAELNNWSMCSKNLNVILPVVISQENETNTSTMLYVPHNQSINSGDQLTVAWNIPQSQVYILNREINFKTQILPAYLMAIYSHKRNPMTSPVIRL